MSQLKILRKVTKVKLIIILEVTSTIYLSDYI
jgi:hypothetical protein